MQYKLYGMYSSLYTARVRAFLRYRKIPFVEHSVSESEFHSKLVKKVGRVIMPVLVDENGEVFQDGSDIIDVLENRHPGKWPVLPENRLLQAISYLFELFGNEGLLRPAMHYRWNFDEHNLSYLENEFTTSLAPQTDKSTQLSVFEFAEKRMRKTTEMLGVTPERIEHIEDAYAEFLQLFKHHLERNPYLLGGHPTIGDFALLGPLYAHLGRDPYPSMQMKKEAPEVFRWIERMHSPEMRQCEYESSGDLFCTRDLPDTLIDLMQFVAEDFLPEIDAHIEFTEDWLQSHPNLEVGTNGLDDPAKRILGKCTFKWRGLEMTTVVMPYRFYLLQKLQAFSKDPDVLNLFKETGLSTMLEKKLSRRVLRENYLEVWSASS
ncbi:MAG: glutathione S-transferase family protein [Pseudomonadota bacterium]